MEEEMDFSSDEDKEMDSKEEETFGRPTDGGDQKWRLIFCEAD